MSANPRFQIGDVVEFDPSSGVNLNGASRGPFQIDSEPYRCFGFYRYDYHGWGYPENGLRLAEPPVDVNIGELL